LALRTAGRWIGKIRKLSGHFRSGFDAMVREAEMEELEKKWREQNEKIMREHPAGGPVEPEPTGAYPPPAVSAEAAAEQPADRPPAVPAEPAAEQSADELASPPPAAKPE